MIRSMVGMGLLASALVAVVAVPLAWALAGSRAGMSALAGVLLVAAFFVVSTATLSWVARVAPQQTMMVALLVYTAKVVALGIVMFGVHPGSVHEGWFAGAIIAGVAVWTVAHLRAHRRDVKLIAH